MLTKWNATSGSPPLKSPVANRRDSEDDRSLTIQTTVEPYTHNTSNVIEVLHPSPNESHLVGLRSAARELGLQVDLRRIGRVRPARRPVPNSLSILCLGPWDYRFPRLAKSSTNTILYTSWPIWDSTYSARIEESRLTWVQNKWQSALESDSIFVAGTGDNVVKGIHSAFDLKHNAVAVGHSIDARFHEMKPRRHSTTPTLGIVARPGQQKGVSRAISVLQRSTASRLIVAGDTDLKRSAIPPGTELRGSLNTGQMAKFVEDIDILLLPSARSARWEELFGMAAAEAMAAGRPVVATTHEGPTTLLGPKLRQYTIPESCYVSDGTLLVDQLASDPNVYSAVSSMSKSQARHYRPEIVTARWAKLIQAALTFGRDK